MIDYGHGVLLGNINEKTLPLLFDWRNRKELRKWFRQYSELNWNNHVEWYHSMRKDPSVEMFVIGSKDDRIIGAGGLTSIDRVNSRAEISLYIAPEFASPSAIPSDYYSYGLLSLIDHAHNTQNLNSVFAEVFEDNPNLSKFELMGFKKDGILRQRYFREGRYIDAHYFSVNRGDHFHD